MERLMKNKIIKKGLFASCLLLGVSGIAMMHYVAEENAPQFNRTQVVVNKDTLSMQEFYDNLTYKRGKGWYYTDKDGKKLNVDSLCDFRNKDKAVHAYIKKIQLRSHVDTVYASYGDKAFKDKTKSDIMYKLGAADSLPNMPAMGKYNYDVLVVREFIADNPKLQSVLDVYNDSHNCTTAHEGQHFLNNKSGMREWNSYPIKFAECCLDEVSANIAQCVAQRKNYLSHGKDFRYITDRFRFYRDKIKSGEITPKNERLSEKEVEVIANMVFDGWMQDKYPIYVKNNLARAKLYNKDAPFQGVQENQERHNELMKKFFNIDGYDFWKYVSKRENEIYEKITPEMKKKWAGYNRMKFRKMTYLDKVEYAKMTQGEKDYKDNLRSNVFKAKMISLFGKDK